MSIPLPRCKTCKGRGVLVVVAEDNRDAVLYSEMCRTCGGGKHGGDVQYGCH